MKQLLYFTLGVVVGAIFHSDIPFLKDLNTDKIRTHLTGLVEAVSEVK